MGPHERLRPTAAAGPAPACAGRAIRSSSSIRLESSSRTRLVPTASALRSGSRVRSDVARRSLPVEPPRSSSWAGSFRWRSFSTEVEDRFAPLRCFCPCFVARQSAVSVAEPLSERVLDVGTVKPWDSVNPLRVAYGSRAARSSLRTPTRRFRCGHASGGGSGAPVPVPASQQGGRVGVRPNGRDLA